MWPPLYMMKKDSRLIHIIFRICETYKNTGNAGVFVQKKRPNGRFYYLTVVVALRLNFHTSSPVPLTNGRSLP